MTARTGLLNNQREYGVNDIGVVLSPSAAQDEVFSLLDIEDVLDPPDLDAGRATFQYGVSVIPSLDVADMTDSTVSEDEEDYINCWNPYCKCIAAVVLVQSKLSDRIIPCGVYDFSSIPATATGAQSTLCTVYGPGKQLPHG